MQTKKDLFSVNKNDSSEQHDPSSIVNILAMTNDEPLHINYSYFDCNMGKLIVASTPKGICHLMFCELDSTLENEQERAFKNLQLHFPDAIFKKQVDLEHKKAIHFFNDKLAPKYQINLHLKATDFQIAVWKVLLTIPKGTLCSYGEIANELNKSKAARAVGTAIGSNPIAYLIPCHRVVQASGKLGGYRWGLEMKQQLIAMEQNKVL